MKFPTTYDVLKISENIIYDFIYFHDAIGPKVLCAD